MRSPFFICLLRTAFFACWSLCARAQNLCPSNIDFELGTLQNWSCATSTNTGTGVYTWTATAPLANRHVITTGSATDPYGGFPIVAPGGGLKSLKLGNNSTSAQMEKVSYTFTVPNNQNKYALIYRYAMVLENPTHSVSEQPFFKVRAFNTTTGATVNCGNFDYISSGSLPGFVVAPGYSSIYYKNWATASLNLSGQAGNTITVEFISADCSVGGHFGYGYIDMNCGVFSIAGAACSNSPTTPLSAPPGFQSYTWYDSSYTTTLGTGMSISVPTPSTTKTYRVRLVPYTGYGCTDTLSTQIIPSSISVNAGRDTTLCNQPAIQLAPTVTGTAPPFTYSWTTSPTLSCTGCANPTATPTAPTDYVITVTDTNGCSARDTVRVTPSVDINGVVTNVTCSGGSTGSVALTAQNGTPSYTYAWNTTPAQATATISNLSAGNYTATVTDTRGCFIQRTYTVGQPPAYSAAITAQTNISCNGGTNGSATVTPTGGTAPYTFSWNTTPAQTTATANTLSSGTYTVTVTDAKGCMTTATATITQPTVLATAASSTPLSCTGTNTGSVTATPTGGSTPYSFSWNTTPVQTTQTVSSLPSGTYTVTVTDAKGCSATATTTITPYTPFAITTTKTDVSCNGGNNGSATVTATSGTPPYTYSWNTTPVQTTATASNLPSGTYTVTVTDSKGCTSGTSVTVTQPAVLTATVTQANVLCNGQSNGTITAVASGGVAPYQYALGSGPYQSSGIFAGLAAGTYTVSIKDTNGCIKVSSITITQPTPLALTGTSTAVPCNGGTTGSVTLTTTGGTTPYQYSVGSGTYSTNSTFSGLTAGTYTFTVKDANNCTTTTTVTITQPTALSATTTQTDLLCNGQTTGSLSVTASGGVGPYQYALGSGAYQSSGTFSGLAAGTYTVSVKDANTCVISVTRTLTQPAALALTPAQTNITCFGLTNGSAGVAVTGGTLPYSYSWNTAPVRTTATISNLASGSYTVTVTDSKACTATATVTITQPPLLTNTLTKTDLHCFDSQDGVIQASTSGGTAPYTYRWDTNPASSSNTITGLGGGRHMVVVTDANGCTRTDTISLLVPTPITASLAVDSVPCYGQATGSLTVGAVQGGTPPYAFLWEDGSGATGTTHSGIASGTYTVRITDNSGCVQRVTLFLSQHPALNVVAGPDTTLCQGSSIRLAASGTALAWSWSPATTLSCNTCLNPTASPQQSTSYILTGTDPYGCAAKDTIRLTVIEHRAVTVGNPQEICAGQSASLTAAGGDAYVWTPTETLQNPNTASPLATPATTTMYQVIISQNSCFKDTLTQKITVNSNPTINGGKDLRLFSGTQTTLQAEVSSNTQSIRWTPANNLSCADCKAPVLTAVQSATYVVTATTTSGCERSDTIRVQVVCDETPFYVANTFTPNGDGQDDWFYPQGTSAARITRFAVTNRWGQVVFEKSNVTPNDQAAGWNGSYKGEPLDSGIFMYVMELICASGEKVILKGDINLIR